MPSRTLFSSVLLLCTVFALGVIVPDCEAGNTADPPLSAAAHFFSSEHLSRAPVPADSTDDTLSTTSHVFVPAQLAKTVLEHSGADTAGIECPATSVVHEFITPIPLRGDVFWIPHSNIMQDGVRCGTNNPSEYMLVVNGSGIINEETAADNGLHYVYEEIVKNRLGLKAFETLHGIDDVHVGIEINMDRKCGGTTYPRGTVFVFMSPSKTHIDLGFAYFPQFSVGMLGVLPNQKICGFSSGKPAPTNTPLTIGAETESKAAETGPMPAEASVADMPSPTSDE